MSAFCCADPADRLVRHVVHEVVALFGRFLGFDRRSAFVDRRIPSVRLAADKSVEILESASPGGPCVKGPAGLVSQTGTS